MFSLAPFAYVQARLQARYGRRPTETTWHSLEASKNLGHFLHMARETPFEPWVRHFTPESDTHDIEASLRTDWKAYVGQVASWHPAQWRAAVEWTGSLVDLPAVVHLYRGHTPSPWMEGDPVLAAFIPLSLNERQKALRASAFAPVLEAMDEDRPPLEGWVDHWRCLWPEESTATRRSLEELARAFSTHLERASTTNASVANEARATLTAQLIRIFRRWQQHPAAVYAHLGLFALDLERLRSSLIRIGLFHGTERGAT